MIEVLKRLQTGIDEDMWTFWCPGCKNHHIIRSRGIYAWQWNNDTEKPTFNPSYLIHETKYNPPQPRCHSYIVNGTIQFLSDCTHALAGQTVTMEPIHV